MGLLLGVIKGDTGNLDYGSYELLSILVLQASGSVLVRIETMLSLSRDP